MISIITHYMYIENQDYNTFFGNKKTKETI